MRSQHSLIYESVVRELVDANISFCETVDEADGSAAVRYLTTDGVFLEITYDSYTDRVVLIVFSSLAIVSREYDDTRALYNDFVRLAFNNDARASVIEQQCDRDMLKFVEKLTDCGATIEYRVDGENTLDCCVSTVRELRGEGLRVEFTAEVSQLCDDEYFLRMLDGTKTFPVLSQLFSKQAPRFREILSIYRSTAVSGAAYSLTLEGVIDGVRSGIRQASIIYR